MTTSGGKEFKLSTALKDNTMDIRIIMYVCKSMDNSFNIQTVQLQETMYIKLIPDYGNIFCIHELNKI